MTHVKTVLICQSDSTKS